MSSLNSLKTRLSSVSSTQKVIKAMELVASSKIKKAREKAESVALFQKTIEKSMNDLSGYTQYRNLLKTRNDGYNLYIIITSDMGLCGAYNANVIKEFEKQIKDDNNYKTVVLGSKGYKKLMYNKYPIMEKIINYGNKDEYELAKDITKAIMASWNKEEIKDIKIVYTDMINPILQETKVIDMFSQEVFKQSSSATYVTIEPSEEEVFPILFEQYILSLLYSTILKSLASEHSYRRNSMDTANKNSLELIDKLSIEFNRVRQSMITQEISEIIGGSESSKKE
ncbi:MAG: ATP synthase F1 subunit gamma [Mycoplasmatales bacterium]